MSDTINTANQMIIDSADSENDLVVQAVSVIKKKSRGDKMTDLYKEFIGEECIITLLGGLVVEATIDEIKDGWIRITDTTNSSNLLNIDFVTRIRLYPRNKNGKKKSIFV